MQFDFSELKGSDITGFNTASGRYYCNDKKVRISNKKYENVSIPQAVGTIAIQIMNFNLAEFAEVSIPQAVGTIAI